MDSLGPRGAFLVKALAAYGFIQVLAQDLGVKTGRAQAELIQNNVPIQAVIFMSGAYVLTDSSAAAGAATMLYFGLKYVYSAGNTLSVKDLWSGDNVEKADE